MNRGKNHMDQWLQQSAEMGNADFKEADWQHMKELLQPKKKRRFIVFWWLVGLLVGCGLVVYLFMDGKKNNENLTEVKVAEQKLINPIEKESTNYEKDTTTELVAPTNEKQPAVYEKQSKTIPAEKESKNPVVDKNGSSKTDIDKTRNKEVINEVAKVLIVKSKRSFSTGMQTPKAATKPIGIVLTGSLFGDNDSFRTVSSTNEQEAYFFQEGKLAKIDLNLSFNQIKLGDSIKEKLLPRDSTVKKKKQPNKNEWSFAAGYYWGNIPLESKGINTKLAYSIKMGSFFVQPSVSASTFSTKEGQVHKQTTVRPPTGTTGTFVSTFTTYFTPSNGFVLQPSLSFGWQMKNMKLFTGLQQNIVLNSSNNINRSSFDSAFFPAPPVGLVSTPACDASSFNGKKSLSMNIGFSYNLGKRWLLSMLYSKMLDYNTAEGVVDERKKRNSFSILIGIRF